MIEIGKKYRTKSGSPVRILCVDRDREYPGTSYPVVGLTSDGAVLTWTATGELRAGAHDNEMNLVEVTPPRVNYVNVYDSAQLGIDNKTEREADVTRGRRGGDCIGRLKITIEDGKQPTFDYTPF